MKKLDTKVNIIPIIAKADTINKTELTKFKTKIMSELVSKIKHFIFTIFFKMMAISRNFRFIIIFFFFQVNNGVQIYQFPTQEESVAEANKQMNGVLPFAVVGSNDFVKVGNKMVRARQYPWGVGKMQKKIHEMKFNFTSLFF